MCGDIAKVDLKSILPGVKIDVILGGFPCQGFSLAGPRQVDDSRNVLYQHFVELVRIKRPKVFVAENVIGIKTLGGGAVFKKILEDFSLLDYTVSAPTINTKNFGVPQDRMRVLFIGIRNDICNGGAYRFPEGNLEVVTLGKALKDLEPVDMNDVCQAPFSSIPVKLAEAIATEVKTILTVEDLRPFLNFENPEDECYGKKVIRGLIIP